MIDLQGADLISVLDRIYGPLVGRTILRASLPNTQLFLKTQTPLTKKEAIQVLDTVLALNGISMINVGDKFVKAVPVAQANQEAAAFDRRDSEQLPDMGSYVTHILQVTNAKPSELQQVLQLFSKLPNSIIPLDTSGILVLRDNAENVKRMLEMIKELDVSAPAEFVSEVIPIKYALAEEIASALNSLSSGAGGTSVGRGATRASAPAAPRAGMPGTPGQPPTMVPTTPAGTPSSTSSFSSRLQDIIRRASSSGPLQILGETKIIADVRSNSLLIFATRQDMATIKDIVNKLDVVLAQVLIETIIMDVQIGDTWNLGVSAGQPPTQTGNFLGGGTINNDSGQLGAGNAFLNSIAQVTTNALTNAISSIYPSAGGLSYFGKLGLGPTFDLALQAAAGDSRINVIQKPHVQTSHAKEAHIFIGSTVPYVSSTYYGGGYGGGPGSSYQQMKVGIDLSVTPFINADGLVVMQISEAIDELAGTTDITGVGKVPNTTSRTLTAEVAVQDRETIILGGFIRNSENLSKSGVPILKDVPVLGALFTSRSSAKERKELIVLMRPTVLRTPELAALQVAEEKKRMPGVTRAEAEIGAEERKAIEVEQKRLFNQTTPLTPEEKKLYSNPPLVAPTNTVP